MCTCDFLDQPEGDCRLRVHLRGYVSPGGHHPQRAPYPADVGLPGMFLVPERMAAVPQPRFGLAPALFAPVDLTRRADPFVLSTQRARSVAALRPAREQLYYAVRGEMHSARAQSGNGKAFATHPAACRLRRRYHPCITRAVCVHRKPHPSSQQMLYPR